MEWTPRNPAEQQAEAVPTRTSFREDLSEGTADSLSQTALEAFCL